MIEKRFFNYLSSSEGIKKKGLLVLFFIFSQFCLNLPEGF